MEIKLIASDLDGTIIDRNNYIAPANLEAIKKIHKHNIKFAVCTGKSYSVAKNHCDISCILFFKVVILPCSTFVKY